MPTQTVKKSYSEKLKDPRWQKKRLEIFQRDNFTCQECGDTLSSLQVHHKRYTKNPWDAPNNDLITLCESCHECKKIGKSNRRILLRPPVRKIETPVEQFAGFRQVLLEYGKKAELSVTSDGTILLSGRFPWAILKNGTEAKSVLLAAGWRKVGVCEFEL